MPGEITNIELHSKYLHRSISAAIRNENQIFPIQKFLTEARAIKSENEIELIRKAATISCEAMLDTKVASRQNQGENYLASIFEFGCKSRNASRLSCPTVVAGGKKFNFN
jgi:Xaa-Pro aminopeptidase